MDVAGKKAPLLRTEGKQMKRLIQAAIAATGALALAACGGNADDQTAENIEAAAGNVAENYEAAADNATNDVVEERLDEKADQVREAGEEKADAVDDSDGPPPAANNVESNVSGM